jgi:hypothetical protein
MVINVAWNRRYGPGGGTRRLHQSSLLFFVFIMNFGGGETGSTCVIKK